MNEQLLLFEMPPPRHFSLVLAVFPDEHTARQIGDLGNSLRERRGISGRMRPISHLHVSLPFPSRAGDELETIVENVSEACGAVSALTRSFEIKFNRVMSFGRGSGNRPAVLVDDDIGNVGIRNLHRLLWVKFEENMSAKFSAPRFTPHLTVLYGQQELAPMNIEPVCWMVKEIVLVLSEVGATKYHRLGQWSLRSDL